jgi:hypothetical protein
MATDTPDLVGLAQRVGEQRDIAQDTLNEIKRLNEVIKTEKDPEQRATLEAIKANLLNQVGRLIANNNATTSIVSSTMGFISEWTRR